MTAQEMFDAAFASARSPRSDAYKLGVIGLLKYRTGEVNRLHCPFREGTAESGRSTRSPA
jgi:hypothetical protein